MVVEISNGERLAQMFRALGDPTRLRIFDALRCCAGDAAQIQASGTVASVVVDESGGCQPADAALTVGDVCCRLNGTASTISHHLRELRLAGLIQTEKRGRSILCSVSPSGVALLQEFLDGSSFRAEERCGCGPAGGSAQ